MHEDPNATVSFGNEMNQQSLLVELEQRQRIFEDVIIQRIKLVQEFVKHNSSKVNRRIDKLGTSMNAYGQLPSASKGARAGSDGKDNRVRGDSVSPGRQDNATPQDVLGNQSHSAIVEIIEEALKWRIQAQDRKVAERMAVLEDRVNQNKENIESL